ncbi:MAG: CidA/LrgA family protein [Cellulosilyticum sp.]|nr:CidA/LrgA family protein [Cellulosilyticum sp.]
MKYIKQFGIILGISFIGELCKNVIPIAIPASIYGLVLMLLILRLGILKLEQVKETANFLIEIMPIMFIPAAVGLLESWGILKGIWFPMIVTTVITTIIVIAVTGRITQFIIRSRKKGTHADIS